MKPGDPTYEKGVRFLLGTQLEDGSWYVVSRAVPIPAYFDKRVPARHGSIHLCRRDPLGHHGPGARRPLKFGNQ